jgi:Lrp/AsnC family leucine-responsive transcriptional regulator
MLPYLHIVWFAGRKKWRAYDFSWIDSNAARRRVLVSCPRDVLNALQRRIPSAPGNPDATNDVEVKPVDNVDLQLLSALEVDGRQSFAALAERAGLSKTSCWSRIQSLEKSGVVQGYGAILNPGALGLKVTAYVQVTITAGMRDAFEGAVLSNPSVIECTTMAGEADYMLKVICADVERLDDLLRYNLSFLPGVQGSTTLICLKTIKQNGSVTAALTNRYSSASTP